MASNELPDGVGRTAVATAHDRRVESGRTDALFHDPVAGFLVDSAMVGLPDDHELAWVRSTTVLGDFLPEMAGYLSLRTSIFDDEIRRAINARCRQVVLLGAGLDARAYRLDVSYHCAVYEIDTPNMIAFKDDALSRCPDLPLLPRHSVPALLDEQWTDHLLGAGFDPEQPTVWCAEGLLVYLTSDAVDRLIDDVTRLSAARSELVIEHGYAAATGGDLVAAGRAALDAQRASFSSTVDEPVTWLGRAGWVAATIDLPRRAIERGRPTPPLVDPATPGAPIFWIAAATLDL